VREELADAAPFVIDGGPSSVGVESTIVDCTTELPRVLRLGGITGEQLRALVGTDVPVGGTTRAPGTLASHYAPRARVEVVSEAALVARAEALERDGRTIGVIASAGSRVLVTPATVTLATPGDADEYARVLYAALRHADVLGLDVVLATRPPPDGIGPAVADRLRRASMPN
jgi:L-threonylcarbamoyladenylate synthase